MKIDNSHILTINGGSSSIKFALYQANKSLKKIFNGSVDRIGLLGTNLSFSDSDGKQKDSLILESSDTRSAANFLIDWLKGKIDFSSIKGIGHRVVFGMKHSEPELITKELLDELHRISPYDTDHLPAEIELIEAMHQRYPKIPQIACYDTTFHHTMPRVAKILPIPRRFEALGIRRYGFHGLSYSYLIEELANVAGEKESKEHVILAHLGNGASLAAVRNGKSIDTSMGFTPAGGLTMGTRPGDLDPGVAWYMMKSENLTPKQFNQIINHESGLLGISETSSDMQDLLAKENDDIRAAEAVALFCYQAKKWIGGFAAALGGLDTLVFAGGIGEKSPIIRSRICEGLGFLGIDLEEKRNVANAPVISKDTGQVVVRVIHTDEEYMIARTVCRVLNIDFSNTMSTGKNNEQK
ncbi:MAG TPA: acetate/propionate family kinase [Ignavibacteriales bacterium]|nr:acetate/propionate family kinase [Ignavibacteriales bacterium]